MILLLGPDRSAASSSRQEVCAARVVMVSPRKLRLVKSDDGRGGAGPPRTAARAAVAPKGHFAAYTRDGRRFAVPIAFLDSSAFRELLRRSEEEFGLPVPANPSITLPCDAAYMDRLTAALAGGRGASESASSWMKKPRSKAAPAAAFFAGAASCLADLT